MREIREFNASMLINSENSLYICAGGFEDRVKGILQKIIKERKTTKQNNKVFKFSIILKYVSSKLSEKENHPEFLKENEKNLKWLKEELAILSNKHLIAEIDIDNILKTNNNLAKLFNEIPEEEIENIFIDISGMSNFLIILVLDKVNKIFYDKRKYVLYTEAKTYYPKKDEVPDILQLIKKSKEDDEAILELGKRLGASGSRETLILPGFAGDFREDLPICLIFLVGYEPSRAIGLLETYRPNMIIACYGISPYEEFKWRGKFSKELHKKLGVFKEYPLIEEEISTFYIHKQEFSELEIIPKLEEIYTTKYTTSKETTEYKEKILYENYNVAITPQCSKLQTVACFEFCQRHPDVQIVFCLPGTFNPKRYSEGIGRSWIYEMY